MRSQPENVDEPGRRKFRAGLSLAVGAVLVLYPVLMYFGQASLGATGIAAALIAICALRIAALKLRGAAQDASRAFGAPQVLLICGGAIVLGFASLTSGSTEALLYYPVLVNAVMLLMFGGSLVYPPTVVERIARWRNPDLPSAAVPYLRRVTIAWCVFFVCNGAIALYTATRASFSTWTLYNGFIAYLLIGAMFGAELLTRRRAMRRARG
jgi:uncharacterized membrane protein